MPPLFGSTSPAQRSGLDRLFSGLKILARSGLILYLLIFLSYKIIVDKKKMILKVLNEMIPPMAPFTLYHEGQASLSQNELQSYVAYFKTVLDYMPDSSAAALALGFCHERLGHRGKAFQYFLKATEFNPKNFWGYYNLGLAYFRDGQYQKAVDSLSKNISIGPKDALELIMSSKIYKDLLLSAPDINEKLKHRLDEGFQEAYCLRMLSYYHLKEFGIMARACAVALQNPLFDRTSWLFYAGVANFELKKFGEAIALFRQYLSLNPGDGSAYEYLGRCAEADGQQKIAQEFFKKAYLFPKKNWFTAPTGYRSKLF